MKYVNKEAKIIRARFNSILIDIPKPTIYELFRLEKSIKH